MNNLEIALLTRVVDDRDFHSLEKARIDESYFTDEMTIQVYNYLRDTFFSPATVGCVPSREMVELNRPAIKSWWFPSSDSIPVLANELRKERVRMELLLLSQQIENTASLNPIDALAAVRAKIGEVTALAEIGADLTMSNAYGELLHNYEKVAAVGGVIGIPYPWHILNEETQGMQGGQFIVIYGRPKSMKSWVAIDMAVHAYIYSRKRVMFYTREMSPQMVSQRVAARIARVDYKKFRNGQLQPEMKNHVFTLLKELAECDQVNQLTNKPFFTVVSDRNSGGSGGGVGWLQAKIRDFKPDIVFVDGMYLMKDDRSKTRSIDWKQIAHISQDLKLTAQEFDIPVIGITQANRAAQKTNGDDLTELAFTDSLGQDADAVFRISKKDRIDEATRTKYTELYLTAPGLREGTFDGLVMRAHPATHFEYVRTLTSEDEQRDNELEAAKHGRGGGGRSSGAGSGPPPGGAQSSFRVPRTPPPRAPT